MPDLKIDLVSVENAVFRDMTRDGCTASADEQKSAFVKWMSSGLGRGYASLAADMQRARPTSSTTSYPYNRVADGLVQKLKKAGLVRLEKAKWHLTDDGRIMMEYLTNEY